MCALFCISNVLVKKKEKTSHYLSPNMMWYIFISFWHGHYMLQFKFSAEREFYVNFVVFFFQKHKYFLNIHLIFNVKSKHCEIGRCFHPTDATSKKCPTWYLCSFTPHLQLPADHVVRHRGCVYYRALDEVHCNEVHCNTVHLHL